MALAYLFPGQGSQSVGMGQDLCAHSQASRDVFDEADSVLGFKISTLCFYGPEAQLSQTVYTQPAMYVTSVAALRALEEAGAPKPLAVAGHSVGEYAALVAAGALSFEAGLHLVERRAQEMHRAAISKPGAMAAVLGLGADVVGGLCRQIEGNGIGPVQAANFNGGGQVVISGSSAAVEAACELAKSSGAKRVLPLPVSGAFHSSLMTDAAESMRHVIDRAEIQNTAIPVVANATADYQSLAGEITANLTAQIDHAVRWEESMERLVADGYDTFAEVGTGKVLAGLMKRIAPNVTVYAVGDTIGVQAFVSALARE